MLPVLIGVVLTVSLFGAIFGVPVLLIAGPPWWQALRVLRGRTSFSKVGAVWALGAAALGTVGFASSLAGESVSPSIETGVPRSKPSVTSVDRSGASFGDGNLSEG